ncbi:MAG: hypothetical protein JOY79_00695 [Acidobacteriaceae bacterium]|nr:hypothetical protein [Acidobacteriaceae bacterium]
MDTTGPKPVRRPYESLGTREKFNVFLRNTYSPYTLITSAFDAGMAQAHGDWYSYGGGMEGYSKRLGAALASNESGAFFARFFYPTLLHQDPRYLSNHRGTFMHRVKYAASRGLVIKNDHGISEFNSSHVLAVFTASTLSNAYYPREERSLGDTLVRGGNSMLDDAITNVLREFWPDIKRKLVRHEPASIKRLEENPTLAKIQQIMSPPDNTGCPLEQAQPTSKPSETGSPQSESKAAEPAAEAKSAQNGPTAPEPAPGSGR